MRKETILHVVMHKVRLFTSFFYLFLDPNFVDYLRNNGTDQIDAEHSFASHYQSTNPLDESYRATWRRTREQAERARTPSRHTPGYQVPGVTLNYPSRPGSASTNDSPGNGSSLKKYF